MIKILATLFQLGYSLMLIGVGAVGVFTAPWELVTIFEVDSGWVNTPEAITMLNQYRFLKASETAFGLFCLWHRRDILDGGISCVVFLAGCGLGVFARGWSMVIDGQPSTNFVVFLVLELITFILVWSYARRSPGS